MKIQILEWSAWAPGIETRRDWADFFRGTKLPAERGDPDASEVPPLLRRRMSRLTRMAVATAMDCCRQAKISASDVRTVFASRHGEMPVTVHLLEQMLKKETLSPMDFSGSVHHTPIGYFSLAAANRQAMRAVAGGQASFCYGFLDAIGMLNEKKNKPVLLVEAEDLLPPPFKRLAGKKNIPHAAAFLLSRAIPGNKGTITFDMPAAASHRGPNSFGTASLDFLHWFLEGQKTLELVYSQRTWRWEK